MRQEEMAAAARNDWRKALKTAVRAAFAAGRSYEASLRDGPILDPRPPRIIHIQEVVASAFGVTVKDLVGERRWVARPRQVAMYLCRDLTAHSLPVIGRHFGGRDHTTVMHAIRVVERLSNEDADFSERVAAIRQHLLGGEAREQRSADVGA